VFGPGEDENRFIPTAIRTALKDGTFICTSPNDLRDFVYVRDVATAFALILGSQVTGAVNIAAGTGLRLGALVNDIIRLSGRGRLSSASHVSGPNIALIGNKDRLKNEVGFTTFTEIAAALQESIDWWRKQMERGL